MAIFKKNEPAPSTKPRERVTSPPRAVTGDAAISIIGQGMTVIGDISTEGIIRIEGEVQGTIRAGKSVILGQAGAIEGNVITEDAIVGGTVSGSIIASNRIELQSTCLVTGEIRTRAEHLKLEEGARFSGKVQMLEEEGRHKPAALPPATQTPAANNGEKASTPADAPAPTPPVIDDEQIGSTSSIGADNDMIEAGAERTTPGSGEKEEKVMSTAEASR